MCAADNIPSMHEGSHQFRDTFRPPFPPSLFSFGVGGLAIHMDTRAPTLTGATTVGRVTPRVREIPVDEPPSAVRPSVSDKPPVRPRTPIDSPQHCDPPWTIDRDGKHLWKRECLR